jgi:hypothetical protein
MRRRLVTALIILSLVLLYVFAFPGRRVVMPDTPYTLVVQPGVSQTSVDLIRDGLTLADEFLAYQEVTTLIEPAEVRVARVHPWSRRIISYRRLS